MPTDLEKLVACLCEEVSHLRDDLYNHALLTRGDAFLGKTEGEGQRDFTTAQMPTDNATPAAAVKAYENKSNLPMVAVLRCNPYISTFPANPITIENSILLVGVSSDKVAPSRADAFRYGGGDPVIVFLPPNSTLFVGAMASGTVTVKWKVYGLRGRRIVWGG